MFNTAFAVGGAQCTVQTVESLTGSTSTTSSCSTSTASRTWSTPSTASRSASPRRRRRRAQHLLRRRHPDPRAARTPQLRARALRALGDRRHRPDEAPAGLHRLDGQQGPLGRHPDPARPGLRLPQRRHVLDPVDAGLDTVGKLVDLAMRVQATPGSTRSSSSPCRSRPTSPTPTGWSGPTTADDLWERIMRRPAARQGLQRGSISADDPSARPSEPDAADGPATDGATDDQPGRAATAAPRPTPRPPLQAGLCA